MNFNSCVECCSSDVVLRLCTSQRLVQPVPEHQTGIQRCCFHFSLFSSSCIITTTFRSTIGEFTVDKEARWLHKGLPKHKAPAQPQERQSAEHEAALATQYNDTKFTSLRREIYSLFFFNTILLYEHHILSLSSINLSLSTSIIVTPACATALSFFQNLTQG